MEKRDAKRKAETREAKKTRKLEREEFEGKGGISFSISGAAKRLKMLKTAFSREKLSGPI